MASTRPLLIPHKRPLLSSKTKNDIKSDKTSCNKIVPRVLNPSAVAAETRMKKPISHPLHSDSNADKEEGGNELQIIKPDPIEVAFAMAPQPFLDPPTWEAMLKRARETANTSNHLERDRGSAGFSASETADQRRQREEREAEYGSMAIRGRSSISGRGKRVRGRGARR